VRVLLDTYAFLWWLDGDRRLSRQARKVIGDEESDILGRTILLPTAAGGRWRT